MISSLLRYRGVARPRLLMRRRRGWGFIIIIIITTTITITINPGVKTPQRHPSSDHENQRDDNSGEQGVERERGGPPPPEARPVAAQDALREHDVRYVD